MSKFTTSPRNPLLALALAVATATGCGDTGDDPALADGGIRGTGSSVGPVSGFGSVFVNGTRFEFDGSVVSNDGISAEDELELGMILRIDGQWQDNGQGTADRVQYDDTLRGPLSIVTPWDPEAETAEARVLNQKVLIDRQTVLTGLTIDSLTKDLEATLVRVSGWRNLQDGSFRASFIGVIDANSVQVDSYELEGVVSNPEPDGFMIGPESRRMQIRYDADNTEFEGVTEEDIVTGKTLEVEGVFSTDELQQPYISASVIREDDQRRYRKGEQDDIEFAGPVSRIFSDNTGSLAVNGLTVKVTGDTELDDDLSVPDLTLGTLVQVEGRYDAFGNIVASEIELRDGKAEVEGAVDSGSLDLQNRQLRVGGVLVQVTSATLINGDDDDYGRRLELGDLAGPALRVEVSGIERSGQDGTRYLEALKIEVEEDADVGYELVGTLENVVGQSWVTVLGVRFNVTGDGVFENGLTPASLQAMLDNPDEPAPLLEVTYQAGGSSSESYLAQKIELEEEDDD